MLVTQVGMALFVVRMDLSNYLELEMVSSRR